MGWVDSPEFDASNWLGADPGVFKISAQMTCCYTRWYAAITLLQACQPYSVSASCNYQIILLGVRGTWMWTTCLRFLCSLEVKPDHQSNTSLALLLLTGMCGHLKCSCRSCLTSCIFCFYVAFMLAL